MVHKFRPHMQIYRQKHNLQVAIQNFHEERCEVCRNSWMERDQCWCFPVWLSLFGRVVSSCRSKARGRVSARGLWSWGRAGGALWAYLHTHSCCRISRLQPPVISSPSLLLFPIPLFRPSSIPFFTPPSLLSSFSPFFCLRWEPAHMAPFLFNVSSIIFSSRVGVTWCVCEIISEIMIGWHLDQI